MKVLVGISGGVDSAYAAYKLKSLGHEVTGAMLVMHGGADPSCARAVCEKIGIPFVTVDCTELFSLRVKEYFVSEYCLGRTPNPCIVCNPEVKFRVLADYALEHGFDRIATGHYASVVELEDGDRLRYALASSRDGQKDQTYMLYRLPQDILGMLILPLSDEVKTEVRLKAAALSLVPEDEKESQEICFIEKGVHYTDYIINKKGNFPEGDFVDREGRFVGRHKGIIHYTVGQRKGLGVSLGYRAFVSDIDPETNRITLTEEGSLSRRVGVGNTVFSGMSRPTQTESIKALVKLRYRAPLTGAVATVFTDGRVELLLDEGVRAVAPGQSAVLYCGDRVLLGGFIEWADNPEEKTDF